MHARKLSNRVGSVVFAILEMIFGFSLVSTSFSRGKQYLEFIARSQGRNSSRLVIAVDDEDDNIAVHLSDETYSWLRRGIFRCRQRRYWSPV